MSYWRMPERLYDDPDELARWARAAHGGGAARGRAKPKKPKPNEERTRREARQAGQATFAARRRDATSGSVSQITRLRPLRLAA